MEYMIWRCKNSTDRYIMPSKTKIDLFSEVHIAYSMNKKIIFCHNTKSAVVQHLPIFYWMWTGVRDCWDVTC